MKKVYVLMVLMLVASAQADNLVYQGTGNWTDAANYTNNTDPDLSGSMPTVFDAVTVNNGGNLTISSGNWLASGLRIGGPDFGWSGTWPVPDVVSPPVWATGGTFNMSGGSLTLGGDGWYTGYGWNSGGVIPTATVNLSGGTITATATWGMMAGSYNVVWNQTGGSFKMFNNNGLGAADGAFASALAQFNITGGVFENTYHPVNNGAGAVVMTVGGTGMAILADVGMAAGATGSIQYILNPGGVIKVLAENDKLPQYLTAPAGYKVEVEGLYNVYSVPEPITITLLGLGGLFLRRRG